jgi:hypothetical protein
MRREAIQHKELLLLLLHFKCDKTPLLQSSSCPVQLVASSC